jgi:hypothetical protein
MISAVDALRVLPIINDDNYNKFRLFNLIASSAAGIGALPATYYIGLDLDNWFYPLPLDSFFWKE